MTGGHSCKQQQVSFILDSGASVHMTNNLSLLNDPVEVETRIGTVAADTQVVARKKGSIETFRGNRKLMIHDVYFVPNGRNLVSLNRLLQRGLQVEFTRTKALVRTKKGKIICTAENRQSLW